MGAQPGVGQFAGHLDSGSRRCWQRRDHGGRVGGHRVAALRLLRAEPDEQGPYRVLRCLEADRPGEGHVEREGAHGIPSLCAIHGLGEGHARVAQQGNGIGALRVAASGTQLPTAEPLALEGAPRADHDLLHPVDGQRAMGSTAPRGMGRHHLDDRDEVPVDADFAASGEDGEGGVVTAVELAHDIAQGVSEGVRPGQPVADHDPAAERDSVHVSTHGAHSMWRMTYVIAQPCVDLKDKACIEECPVDCIYEGERSLYIHPDECVDCGACEPVCPVEAIYYEDDTPEQWADYYKANVEFFDDLGSPGGAAKMGMIPKDHPLIAALPPQVHDH